MNAGQPLPAFGNGWWLPAISEATFEVAPPLTIFIFAPLEIAPTITSAGKRPASMLLASRACAPRGPEGIGCTAHLRPAFSQ